MLVTCKACKIKIEKESAYKVKRNDKNEYYCNEKEYIHVQQEKSARLKVLELVNDIFGYVVINTVLQKEISEIAHIYTYTAIASYMQDNLQYIQKFMNKDFSNEYGKIRYLCTIIKNNLIDYIKIVSPVDKIIEGDIINTKYQPKTRKKCLNDYLTELE
jgi:YHS domain-containing protein